MGFREGVAQAVKGKYCEFAQKTQPFARWLYEKTRPIQPGSSASFWDTDNHFPGMVALICDMPEPPEYPPRIAPFFPGGQCGNTPYRIYNTYVGQRADGTETAPITDNIENLPGNRGEIYGPIEGPIYTPTGTGQLQIQYRAFDENGNKGTFPAGGGPYEQIRHIRWEYQRKDGGPDDCGNAPGEKIPPFTGDDNKYPINITYNEGDDVTVEVPANLTFAFPIFNVDGNLNVPFNIENANINLNGEFNLSTGDITFDFGGGNSDNEKCCLGERTEDEPPQTEEDPPPEEEEERDIIIGAIVSSQFDADEVRVQVYGQGDGPKLYHSRLGNIYFVVEISGRRLWCPAVTVQHSQVYIPCPAGFAAVDVVGFFRQGVTFQITPVYRRISETEYPST